MNTIKTNILAASLMGLSALALGQTSSPDASEDSFGGSIAAKITQTDNARKAKDVTISERQDELRGNIFANYENSLIRFNADYGVNGTNYNEDSQENRNILEGQAELQVGKDKDVFDLLLSQSQRSQYSSPDDTTLNENLDDRTVWSAVPTLKLHLSEVDTLAIQGSYSLVEYRTNSLRDSTRTGGTTFWRHRLSAISSFKLTGGTNQVEYPNGSLDDYDAHYATLSYTAQTRYFRYTLLAGINKATFADGGADYSAPTYKLDATYENGEQTITLNASQDITDSSIGNANQVGVDPNPSNDGVGIDQMERKRISLNWYTRSLCARCSVNVFAQYRDDQYRRLTQDDNDETSAGFSFRYKLAERSNVELSYSRQWQRYAQVVRPNFNRDYLNLKYLYDFTRSLNGGVFYQFEAVDGELGSNEYEQNGYGFSLTYSF